MPLLSIERRDLLQTRSVAFLSRLLEAGVDVRFADLPMIEGATGKFVLLQMAAVAELEAGMISARTKAALAAAKRRGVKQSRSTLANHQRHLMHPRGGQRLVQRGAIRALPALNFRELGNDATVAAVQISRNSLTLRFDAKPAFGLLPRGNAVVRDEAPPAKPFPAPSASGAGAVV